MKRVIILLVLLCIGCVKKSDNQMNEIGYGIYRDSRTGCDYIIVVNQRTLVSRMGSDGKQICIQGTKP